MHAKHNEGLALGALRGKQFDPPRSPSILRSGVRIEFADRRSAREIGRANVEEYSLKDEGDDQYYYEQFIDEQANQALAGTQDGHQQARANVEKAGEDARQQRMDAEAELDKILAEDAKDEEIERERAHLRGIGIVAYVFVVILGYVATLPTDVAAATGLPLSPSLQLLVAITLGGVVMLAAHIAGDKALELEQARPTRAENPGVYEKLKHEYVASLSIPIMFIAAVAVWRAVTFDSEAKLVGGLFPSALAASVAFAFLALAAFLAVFFAARSYLRVKPLREIRKKRAKNKPKLENEQETIDKCERVEAQAKLNLDHLNGHEPKVVAAIEAWRDARKRRLRHRAGVAGRKHQRRLENKGLRPPGPPPTSLRRHPDKPEQGGGPRQPVNLDRLVEDVRESINGCK